MIAPCFEWSIESWGDPKERLAFTNRLGKGQPAICSQLMVHSLMLR
jgi:hypothetical protein